MANQSKRILIVDDDEKFREICGDIARDLGHTGVPASDGIEALERIQETSFSLALVDLKMPRMDGIDLLYHIREFAQSLPVIIITGHGSVDTAVEAMKLGAVDYIVKPCTVKEIKTTMMKILQKWNASWRTLSEGECAGKFDIIGRSRPMKTVYERIEAMCHADNTVLIMGESGVGKELVAKAIHYFGDRVHEPFIPIDCSVLSLNIVESELFGHEKGAFTDAQHSRVGLLKLAGRGTVFLEEITEIPLQVQAKLLRAIQEREIRPLGATEIEKIDARIIAATNRELERAVEEGKFREDLFYRLHVIPISVPPLRERKEDIPLLVDHFIKKFSSEKKHVSGITPEAMKALESYRWPGNVRELENVIQQAIALGTNEVIRRQDLPAGLHKPEVSIPEPSAIKSLKEIEKEAILKALQLTAGSKLDAARILGIGKTTLYDKLKKYGIDASD